MNENFLSRGKREDNGEWTTGYYVKLPEHHIIFDLDGNAEYIIPETVGRCTGLTDRHGTRIFEGDIIRMREFIFVVKFGECGGERNSGRMDNAGYIGFYVKPIGIEARGFRTDILYWVNPVGVEILGNIHDSPELLETD